MVSATEFLFRLIPDVDGYTSSAILIRYLHRVNPNLDISWRNQEGKEHEIKSNNVPNDIDLVLVADAGSNDIEEHKKLLDRGIDVVVIDHHEVEVESEYAIVVNNQLGDYKNRDLSGAGVIYKVIQALDEVLGVSYADDYLDLVSIGLIGDMMPLIDEENRYYITQGLNNIKNPMLKQLFQEQEYSTKGVVSPATVSFYIAPLFNAVVRTGTIEEKNQVFEALLCDGSKEVYYERGKKNERLITNTIRMMKRVRQQQNKIVDKSVEKINEKIDEKNLLDNKLLIVEVTGLLDKEFTGLAANRLLNDKRIKRPVLLLRYDEESGMLRGSARGYSKGYIKDFKQFLNDTGYFEYVAGHANAFGSSIEKNKLIELNEKINKRYKDVDFGSSVYEVDFILEGNNVPKILIETIDKNYFLWGQGVEEPLLALENIQIERRNFKLIGAHKNHLKFTYGGTEYVKFFIDDEDKKRLIEGNATEMIVVNVIGRASINEFRGKRTGQIIIEDYEVVRVKERKMVF